MARIRVYTRFPDPIEFRFVGYTAASNGEGMEVAPLSAADRIVLNGTTSIVNQSLVTTVAMTEFKGDQHDVASRRYSVADFDRLKEHPKFKEMVNNGEISIDTTDDLSRDENGVGMLTDTELRNRLKAKAAKDGDDAVGLKVNGKEL